MKPIPKYGILALGLIFFGCLSLVGQTNSLEEIARNIWLEKNSQAATAIDFHFDRVTSRGNLVVFERFNPASFVMISAKHRDRRLIGYSCKNLFFGKPDGLENGAIQSELLEALATNVNSDGSGFKGTRTVDNPIGPLIQTQWGQGKFFNYYCPLDSKGPNGRVYVGCVAVAAGQIVRYYSGFNSINLQYGYDGASYGYLNAQIGPYNWSTMENNPVSVDLATSDLLSDLGVLLNMTYGVSASSTNSHRTLEAFHELGYVNGVILRKSKFTPESWAEVFYQNLSEYKPIMVTGGGHAFICDGYDKDGFFHFNLGWDGYGDGFYPLNSVMGLPVNEAFAELQPVSWPDPPINIWTSTASNETSVHWNYYPDKKPVLSRVYVDDQLFRETTDTEIPVSGMNPGVHLVYVSAVYSEGESRWIGPVEVLSRGKLLTVRDPILYAIFKKSLGFGPSDTQEHFLYEGDLSRITNLEIDRQITSLDGLSWCNHLKRLVIQGYPEIELDASPLENLSCLRILEWNKGPVSNPEILGKLDQLKELRVRQTLLESLDILKGIKTLMKFEYSDAPVSHPEAITGLTLIDDLVLKNTGLTDVGFVSGLKQIIHLDLSGNQIAGTEFLSGLTQLQTADLSNNQITRLSLADELQSLTRLDVSDNAISSVVVTAELNSLNFLDLSNNKLTTPERLLLYTPALAELDLSHNQLRNMGKQRCQKLEILDVSGNDLIVTDWISLQPNLKRLNLEHNRISDLSGLIRNKLYRQMIFLGLDRNPLSKESFVEWLPTLVSEIDSMSRPQEYQPLSPCYLSPANGSRLIGPEVTLEWVADNENKSCVYDLFVVQDDTLAPVLLGIESCKGILDKRPDNVFSWVVAARTADTIFYSGVNNVMSTAPISLPFTDDFESYRAGESLSSQSDYWLINEDPKETSHAATIVTTESETGYYCLEIGGNETVSLPVQHLDLPYLNIKFSALIPSGRHGVVRVNNTNGMYFRLVWNESNTGSFYVNDKLYKTFTFNHNTWSDYEISAHARNNNLYVKVSGKVLMNEYWMVPEGIICTESIEFTGNHDGDNSGNADNFIFIDNVKLTSAAATSADGTEIPMVNEISVYPNPCAGQVNMVFAKSGRYTISIIDMAGREVYRQQIETAPNTVHSIPLPGLVPGVYTLHTDSGTRPIRIVTHQSTN